MKKFHLAVQKAINSPWLYANWSESDIIHMAVAQFIMSSGYVYWELPDKLQKEVQSSFIK
jgi:hypothetical protein